MHKYNLKVAHINICSLCPKLNEVKYLLQAENISILGVTETWLTDKIPEQLIEIEGYTFFRADRGSRGGGVGVYVLSSLNASILTFDDYVSNPLESIWLMLKVSTVNIALGVLYRPPNPSNFNTCMNMINTFLEEVLPRCDEVIIVGDLNINLLQCSRASETFDDILDTYHMKQIVQNPTRKKSLLDIIAVSNADLVQSEIVHIDLHGVSDHQVIKFELTLEYKKPGYKFKTYRNFKYFDLNHFQMDLESANWYEFYTNDSINAKVEIINNTLLHIFDIHAPLVTRKISKPKAAWLTDVVKMMMKERDVRLRKYKHTREENDWKEYKEMRNLVVDAVRQEKKSYLSHLSKFGDSKTLWGTLQQLNVYNKKSYELPDIFNDPDLINNHFVESVKTLSVDVPNDTLNYYLTRRIPGNPNSFNFHRVTQKIMSDAIKSIKSNSCGSDGINFQMLKLCLPFITPHLIHLFNCCLDKGHFPEHWKTAVVVPLPKVKNPKSLNEIRPISLLPTISKIFEKILASQIKEYLLERDIYPVTQSGYRKAHSSTTAMLKIVDDIIEAYDKGEATALVLLDFTKAFDLVDHKLLCAKLKYLNFSSKSRELISSYLEDRNQYVSLNNKNSEVGIIKKGVPQGSVLGPLLFILYVFDMNGFVEGCKMHQFADDTQIYINFQKDSVRNSQHVLQLAVSNLTKYSQNHGLKLNGLKTKLIIFGPFRHEVSSDFKINIDTEIVCATNLVRNLGFLMDNDLRFRSHVNQIIQRGYNALRNLYRSKHFLDSELKKRLCDSLVLNLTNYGDVVYGPCLDQLSANKIQKLQNSCARFITKFNRREHCTPHINNLKWLKMHNRRAVHLASLVHNIVINKEPKYLFDKLKLRHMCHSVNVRGLSQLSIPYHRTSLYERSFSYNSAKIYNNIPHIIRDKTSSFKNCYKRLLLSQQVLI
ncbi:unnamed protein product [Callosobruchus maculatus]|uniref:Reverse transcriptase domain-containing protein n=1 Tax=Callosobruchus maculatus TaxID=64391 RepID=A0A653DLT0_CALMS|nr:unnamed protein product [Callosobruchus maculatus]